MCEHICSFWGFRKVGLLSHSNTSEDFKISVFRAMFLGEAAQALGKAHLKPNRNQFHCKVQVYLHDICQWLADGVKICLAPGNSTLHMKNDRCSPVMFLRTGMSGLMPPKAILRTFRKRSELMFGQRFVNLVRTFRTFPLPNVSGGTPNI